MKTLPNFRALSPAELAEAFENDGYNVAIESATFRPDIRPATSPSALLYEVRYAPNGNGGFFSVNGVERSLVVVYIDPTDLLLHAGDTDIPYAPLKPTPVSLLALTPADLAAAYERAGYALYDLDGATFRSARFVEYLPHSATWIYEVGYYDENEGKDVTAKLYASLRAGDLIAEF
jgi:hypothetical protein